MVREEERATLAETLTRLFEATERLVRQSLRLARSELKREAGELGRRSLWLVGASALLLVGVGLLNAAAAVVLSARFGTAPSLAGLGLLNLLAGAVLLAWRLKAGRASASGGRAPAEGAALQIETLGGGDGAAA